MRTSPRSSVGLADVVFFLDRALGTNDVRQALQSAGAVVEIHADHFDPDVEDPVWIEFAGSKGWVILSKDKHLKSNILELRTLLQANTASFLLTNAEATGAQMGRIYLNALPQMLRFLRKFSTPFIATVSNAGIVSLVHNYSSIAKRLTDRHRRSK